MATEKPKSHGCLTQVKRHTATEIFDNFSSTLIVSGGVPGSHFYVEYRKVGMPSYEKSEPQTNFDNTEVGGLEPNTEYEFRVVSVDGSYETPSLPARFDTSGGGE